MSCSKFLHIEGTVDEDHGGKGYGSPYSTKTIQTH